MVRGRISKTARLSPVLSVGGLDPSGHAGILADARVFEQLGIPYRVAISAVTAQSKDRFFSWEPVSLPLFRAQLEAADGHISGVKIGMLADPPHLAALLHWLQRRRPSWVVWDPVIRSSTGKLLFTGNASDPNLRRLLAFSDALTPNIPEAEWLLGTKMGAPEIAAKALFEFGSKTGRIVALKGGHGKNQDFSVDWIAHAQGCLPLRARRRHGSRRGSGCTFASALLVGLLKGKSPLESARFAKKHVLKSLFD